MSSVVRCCAKAPDATDTIRADRIAKDARMDFPPAKSDISLKCFDSIPSAPHPRLPVEPPSRTQKTFSMSKAFTKESDTADGEAEEKDALPVHAKNYVTPAGLAALEEELGKLSEERHKVVAVVSWAAGNG